MTTVCGRLDDSAAPAPLRARAYTLPPGVALTKEIILGDVNAIASPRKFIEVLAKRTASSPPEFCFDLPIGSELSVFAFADMDGDGRYDASTEPSGWMRNETSGPPVSVTVRATAPRQELPSAIALYGLTQFVEGTTTNGTLKRSKDGRYWQMRLSGTGPQRAHAHGYLAARQVVEFFRFFILESVVKSAARYAEDVAPAFRQRFTQYKDPEFVAEATALLEGMRARAAADGEPELMHVAELKRDFGFDDLFAINAYDAFESWSCSQLVAWGARTSDGETLTARNMDGETDLRHATVAFVLLFAHAAVPSSPGAKSFVSIMWPGHLGSFSMLSEDGI